MAFDLNRQRICERNVRLQERLKITRTAAHRYTILRSASKQDWFEALDEVGIPVGPVLTHDKALTNLHAIVREMVVDVEHPTAGNGQAVGIPVKFSEMPGRIQTPAPTLGQHTDEVLAEIVEST